MPLEDVPPIVFSEAMRDVDLFVGVSSIAADPAWQDHGDDRYTAYWRQASFGELQRFQKRAEVSDRLGSVYLDPDELRKAVGAGPVVGCARVAATASRASRSYRLSR